MMIKYNISPETVNCLCCESDISARVPDETMNIINSWLTSPLNKMKFSQETERPFSYWICNKQEGIVPQLIKDLIILKRQYRDEDNDSMEYAVKILINGFYGLFGNEHFRYSNFIVSELTTSYGKVTLAKMEEIARANNFTVIYGDTDSLFLTDAKSEEHISEFTKAWSELYDDIEISSEAYRLLLLLDSKNYIAYPSKPTKKNPNMKPLVKGIKGNKSNEPKWINKLQKLIVDNLDENKKDLLIVLLHKEYNDFVAGRIDSNLLKRKIELGKDPNEYPNDVVQKSIGLAQNKKEGETIWYYNIDKGKSKKKKAEWDNFSNEEKTKHYQNLELICKNKYIKDMKATFEKQLTYLGIDFDKDIVGKITL